MPTNHQSPIPYTYRAKVKKIKDGDTIDVDVDLPSRFGDMQAPTDERGLCDYGFGVWSIPNLPFLWFVNITIRLDKINTSELDGADQEAAIKAKNRLEALIGGEEIFLETIRAKRATTKRQTIQDKNGRYLGIIYYKGVNINQQMLEEGYAKPYNRRS
jgi:micrococcal nuclease